MTKKNHCDHFHHIPTSSWWWRISAIRSLSSLSLRISECSSSHLLWQCTERQLNYIYLLSIFWIYFLIVHCTLCFLHIWIIIGKNQLTPFSQSQFFASVISDHNAISKKGWSFQMKGITNGDIRDKGFSMLRSSRAGLGVKKLVRSMMTWEAIILAMAKKLLACKKF